MAGGGRKAFSSIPPLYFGRLSGQGVLQAGGGEGGAEKLKDDEWRELLYTHPQMQSKNTPSPPPSTENFTRLILLLLGVFFSSSKLTFLNMEEGGSGRKLINVGRGGKDEGEGEEEGFLERTP